MLRATILLNALLLAAPAANAATMTFSSITDPSATTYFEDGISYQGNGDFSYSLNSLHMDSANSPAPSQAVFSMSSRFDAVGFDLLPIV